MGYMKCGTIIFCQFGNELLIFFTLVSPEPEIAVGHRKLHSNFGKKMGQYGTVQSRTTGQQKWFCR